MTIRSGERPTDRICGVAFRHLYPDFSVTRREAVDLHYWATGNQEWYDPGMSSPSLLQGQSCMSSDWRLPPDAMTTKDGKLQITITEEPIHGLNFRSGMLQSWNKVS